MKNIRNKQHVKIYIITIFVISCVIILLSILAHYTRKNMKGTYVYHDDFRISANKEYLGIIDKENEQVKIITHSGKERSHINISDSNEGYPDQIALGDISYFLLYQASLGERDSKIIQYSYDSNKIKESLFSDIATITFRNGYLFLGEWEYDEDIEERYYYSEPYSNSFYAHSYVTEKDFDGQIRSLKPDYNGKCQVGVTEMYLQQKGYFFSEPRVKDYSGTSGGFFRADDKDIHYRAETKQEEKNRNMLLETIGAESDSNDLLYEIYEHQEKNLIYGVCNTYKHWIPHHSIEQENVIKSYAYRIDPAKEIMTILGQEEKCLGIVASETVFVYQKGNKIFQENLVTGDKKVIYNIKNTNRLNLYVNGDYLLVVEWDRKLFSRTQSCYPVRWKDME